MSALVIDLQNASGISENIPTEQHFHTWASTLCTHLAIEKNLEVTIRLVSAEESQTLNHQYRQKDYATNILSFQSDIPDYLEDEFESLPLGDLVICVPVVTRESLEQNKNLHDHWAHLTIHGFLHLLGYDHEEDNEAEEMEGLEIAILAKLSIANPYAD